MAEDLFWAVLDHLTTIRPSFGGKTYKGFPADPNEIHGGQIRDAKNDP